MLIEYSPGVLSAGSGNTHVPEQVGETGILSARKVTELYLTPGMSPSANLTSNKLVRQIFDRS